MEQIKTLFLLLVLSSITTFVSSQAWTLQACFDQAHSNNIQIRMLEQNTKINDQYLKQSKAARTPAINTTINTGYNWGRTFDQARLRQIDGSYQNGNFSTGLNMPIFKGGSIINSIQKNRLILESSEYALQANKENLSLNIAEAYLQILQIQERIKTSRNQISSSQQQVQQLNLLYEKGLISKNMVLQQEGQLASEEYQNQQNLNALRVAKISLMQLIEIPISDNFEIVQPVTSYANPPIELMSTETIYHNSLSIRPQIKQAKLKTESSLKSINITKGERLPSLSLTGNLFSTFSSANKLVNYNTTTKEIPIGYLANDMTQIVMGSSLETSPTSNDYNSWNQLEDNLTPSVGISLTIPILNKRSYKTQVEIAKINSKIIQLEELNTKNQLRKNIELAQADYINSKSEYLAAEKQLVFYKKTFTNAEYQFSNGIINPTEFLIEKNQLANAENNMINAKYQLIFSRMIIQFYNGEQLSL